MSGSPFEVILHLRTTEQGGRRRPLFDKARATCDNGDYLPNSAPHDHDALILLARAPRQFWAVRDRSQTGSMYA